MEGNKVRIFLAVLPTRDGELVPPFCALFFPYSPLTARKTLTLFPCIRGEGFYLIPLQQ